MTRMLGTSREPTLRGRDDQIGELRSAVDSAMSGRLSVVVIEGEAGIGKTRLLDQALQIAGESGCQVATAKAEEMEHGRPFGVIAAALGCARDAPDGRRTLYFSESAPGQEAAYFITVQGQTPAAYVIDLRVERAAEQLQTTRATVATVANDNGFASEFSLNTAFKRRYGVSPGRWRRRAARLSPPST